MDEPKKSDPVVFIDIDGVLNRMEDGSSYLVNNVNKYGLSPSIMEEFKNFLRITKAEVVISSNWRKKPDNGTWRFRGTYFSSPLTKLESELADFKVSRLPYDKYKKDWYKVDYVSTWIKDQSKVRDVSNFVVFDDSELSFWWSDPMISSRFVEVHSQTGLTKFDLNNALGILGFTDISV